MAVFTIPKLFSTSYMASENLTGRARRLAFAIDLAFEQYRRTHLDSAVDTVTPGNTNPLFELCFR
jgi:hypothetical protein